jgi:hypothetical protein
MSFNEGLYTRKSSSREGLIFFLGAPGHRSNTRSMVNILSGGGDIAREVSDFVVVAVAVDDTVVVMVVAC